MPDWTFTSPRDELAPEFANESGTLVARSDSREGLIGWWSQTVNVEGGKHYQFAALRKCENLRDPRRCAVARIVWQDATGGSISRDDPAYASYMPGTIPDAAPDFPLDGETDRDGWTKVSGTYRAPSAAKLAVIELQFCWAANATVRWKDVALTETSPPPKRIVRLAAIHLRPSAGSTNAEKCAQFTPLIEQAAKQRADLVVLPETLTFFNNSGKSYADCAEPIPGPSTDFFSALAKMHNLYIVAGLLERNRHRVHNVAVLIGPSESVVGTYRKICLPRGEIEGGLAPGDSYPVFNTRFGKVGMMVCYDGFFPEIARNLSNNGAEVIAFPVWGCNPMLVAARACENQVYLVSSTYTDVADNWTITGIFGQDGQVIAQAKDWHSIALAEVDLNQRLYWPCMGDFKAELPHRRP